ncbi:MAG TPA: hypothetical protein VE032_11245 [Actinomycetota bacterium]|nr:hypothetical protein [Actinomycetota bacterium]
MSRRIVAVAALLAASAALAGPPAAAGDVPRGRMGIGDSIMLSASDELGPLGYVLDAEVGRQFSTGVEIVRRRANHGTLPRIVIVHLGTNGPIPSDGCDDLRAAAANRQIFVVTVKVPRSWEGPNNDLLNACANASDRVHVIRWYARASRHPEWYGEDGYHPNAAGQAAFAALIDEVVDDTMAARRAAR